MQTEQTGHAIRDAKIRGQTSSVKCFHHRHSSKMYLPDEVSPLAKRLVEVTYQAMWKASGPFVQARDWAMSGMRSSGTHGETVIRS